MNNGDDSPSIVTACAGPVCPVESVMAITCVSMELTVTIRVSLPAAWSNSVVPTAMSSYWRSSGSELPDSERSLADPRLHVIPPAALESVVMVGADVAAASWPNTRSVRRAR